MPPGRTIGDGRRRTLLSAGPSAKLIPLALLALAVILAGCSQPTHHAGTTTTTRPPKGSPANPVAPSEGSVVNGRFIQSVEVNGNLEVSPPPKDAVPGVSGAYARSFFDAYAGFQGTYEFDVLGFGSATIQVPGSPGTSTTTTSPSSSSTSDASPNDPVNDDSSYSASPSAASTTTTKPTTPRSSTTTTTSTTAPRSATTTPPPASSTTTAPSTTTTLPPPPTTTTVPGYDQTLAWVGIAVSETQTCSNGTPATVALLIDALSGHDVMADSSSGCPGVLGVFSHPDELESVPWTIVGSSSTAVTVTIPACGSYVGWTNFMSSSGTDIQVQARVRYDPSCARAVTSTAVINLVVPLGSTNTSPPHAPIGRIDNLDVLP